MILLVDNYDSFVHNLARYFQRLGHETQVARNDAVTVAEIRSLRPDAIVISPGPCTPDEAGCCVDVVQQFADRIPILGVCLGHQAIAAAFGARIIRAHQPMHGRASEVFHNGAGILKEVPSPFVAGRYHSLVVDEATLPDCLDITARAADGTVMGLQHRSKPVFGVQFHPESILTDYGYNVLAGFLREAGLTLPKSLPDISDELVRRGAPPEPAFSTPLTF